MIRRTLALGLLIGGFGLLATSADSKPQDTKAVPDRGRENKQKIDESQIIRGKIVALDPAKRELGVMGIIASVPSGKVSVDEDRIAPESRTGSAPDLTGSGRTGNAPARVNTFVLKVPERCRITLGRKIAKLSDLRPDLYVRVLAQPEPVVVRNGNGENSTTGQKVPEPGTSEEERSKGAELSGTGGSNSAASPARVIPMIAERIEAYLQVPPDFPPRPDPPKSGPLGSR